MVPFEQHVLISQVLNLATGNAKISLTVYSVNTVLSVQVHSGAFQLHSQPATYVELASLTVFQEEMCNVWESFKFLQELFESPASRILHIPVTQLSDRNKLS